MTITPDVPTSSRCTMPCRSAAPLVEIRNPAAARCPTTVGPLQPGLGCTATPTGLSMTTSASSSCRIVMPSTTSGTTATGSTGAGMDTSSIAPDSTRWDFAGAWPSTLTFPAATRSAARVRENPNMRARAVSTRSPARPSGTVTVRWSCPASLAGGASRDRRTHCSSGGRRPLRRAWVRVPSRATPRAACTMMNAAATLMHMSATLKIGQCGSCDEVDDVASHRTRRTEDPVGEVAENAGEQEAEPQRPADARQPPRDPQRGQGGSDGHHGSARTVYDVPVLNAAPGFRAR